MLKEAIGKVSRAYGEKSRGYSVTFSAFSMAVYANALVNIGTSFKQFSGNLFRVLIHRGMETSIIRPMLNWDSRLERFKFWR